MDMLKFKIIIPLASFCFQILHTTQQQSSGDNSNISFILQFSGIQMEKRKWSGGPFFLTIFYYQMVPFLPRTKRNLKE